MSLPLEVLNTGTELLLGAVLNTHLRFFAEALFPLGLRIQRQLTVPDGPAIADNLRDCFPRCRVLLITGGLGPTTDDITREAVAELLGLRLVHDETIMEAIRARFARRNLPLSARVELQALRPPEATVLTNEHGTAPGLYLPPLPVPGSQILSPHLFLLPGPPRELKPMFEQSVIPILRSLLPSDPVCEKLTLKVLGLGESMVEEKVGADLLALGVELGYCARPGEVDVRVIGTPAQIQQAEELIRSRIGAHVVCADERSIEKILVDLLTERSLTLATAESCTGGSIAHHITNVPGSSAVFRCGWVTYANDAKTRDLGVPQELLQKHGAVSEPVATAMASGALARSGADFAAATTGIAGPGGGSPEKPVGTIFIALARKDGPVRCHRFQFRTERESFKALATQTTLNLLREAILASD